MVFTQIQQDRHPRTEFFDPFQLETADFDNAPLPIVAGKSDQRRADVAADEDFRPVRLEHLSYQSRRRALAIGARDGDDRKTAKPIGDLDFAEDLDATAGCLLEQRIRRRHTRAGHDQIHPF